jgi:hypothetical protein
MKNNWILGIVFVVLLLGIYFLWFSFPTDSSVTETVLERPVGAVVTPAEAFPSAIDGLGVFRGTPSLEDWSGLAEAFKLSIEKPSGFLSALVRDFEPTETGGSIMPVGLLEFGSFLDAMKFFLIWGQSGSFTSPELVVNKNVIAAASGAFVVLTYSMPSEQSLLLLGSVGKRNSGASLVRFPGKKGYGVSDNKDWCFASQCIKSSISLQYGGFLLSLVPASDFSSFYHKGFVHRDYRLGRWSARALSSGGDDFVVYHMYPDFVLLTGELSYPVSRDEKRNLRDYFPGL